MNMEESHLGAEKDTLCAEAMKTANLLRMRRGQEPFTTSEWLDIWNDDDDT